MVGSLEEFQLVLSELAGDENMDSIRVEFEKLLNVLKKSRENERRLMSKCRELNAEILSSSTKVAAALKLSQEDETTIASLKRVKMRTQMIPCRSFAYPCDFKGARVLVIIITCSMQELDKAWKMVDAAHDKEKRDKETITNLKEEVSKLVQTSEQQSGFSMEPEHR